MSENNLRSKGKSLIVAEKNYIVLDTETTGFDPSKNELIEIAAIKYENYNKIDEFQTLIKPNEPISSYIQHLTGITNEMVENAPSIEDVLPKFLDFVGNTVLVAHNAHFDINFLYDNVLRYCNLILNNDFIDTLRLSRKFFPQSDSHSLAAMCDMLEITNRNAHRALSDCQATNELYKIIANYQTELSDKTIQELQIEDENLFLNKRIAFKGTIKTFSEDTVFEIAKKCGAKPSEVLYRSSDYLVLGADTYSRYEKGIYSQTERINQLVEETGLKILSEYQFYDLLGVKYYEPKPKERSKHYEYHNLKKLTTENTDFCEGSPVFDKEFVFTGTLDRMKRTDAAQLVVDNGGRCGNSVTKKTNFLVLGNNDFCKSIKDGKSSKQKKAEDLKAKGFDIEVIPEDTFYKMINKSDF